jgi:hypothetical protein
VHCLNEQPRERTEHCAVLEVLHTNHRSDAPRFPALREGDIAEPDVTHQALALKISQQGERSLERAVET